MPIRNTPETPVSRTAIRRVHYVLSTHWDREWYQTFQDYRRRLVRLLDRVLDDLESGTLRGPFTTDGQSILLDDYLEIRPERRAQIERFARDGHLKIGPWYVLPDEWLVSGESLIRNLRLGRKQACDFGGVPSDAGFVCDLFGHIGQLPQILKNFGIRGTLVWRGLEPRKAAHLAWRGADGTTIPAYRFGRAGYCDYSWDVRRSTERAASFDPETAPLDLRAFLDKEAARTHPALPLIVFDGGDHLEYDSDHYSLLFAREPSPDFPYAITHSTLDAWIDDWLACVAACPEAVADTVSGELREPARSSSQVDQQWLIPGVLSSRVWIKQQNAECQSLLTQWAEPFAALATAFAGAPAPATYLETAWRWLLQNHPHDSICGCSIDEVHEDMKYRFAQCRQIAAAQADESLALLAASIPGELTAQELRVLVANPLPRPLDEPVDLTLHIPAGWGCFQEFFGFEPKPAFRIHDGVTGEELPYQLLAQDMARTKLRISPIKYPEAYKTNDVTVCVRLRLPALGYTTLTVREGAFDEPAPRSPVGRGVHPVRHPASPGLVTGECSMANEHLAVAIGPNGTLAVTDKRTGQIYTRLLTFEDVADIGDGWYHGQPVNDQRFVSSAAAADVALLHDGPFLAQFRIRTTLRLPDEFLFDTRTRSGNLVPLTLDTRVTLRAGSDRIEVCTEIDNTIKDHRLRVLFPTGASAATHYLADGAFDVVERPVAPPADNHLARELAVETTPQQTWTAVVNPVAAATTAADDLASGGDAPASAPRGLAIISTGLMESAVRDQPGRPVALTLLRATRRTVFTDGQPAGQLPGRHVFRYWIIPQATATPDRRALCEAGQQLAAGFRTAQLRAPDLLFHRRKDQAAAVDRTVPVTGSLFVLKGSAVVTSACEVAGALEVRLFNPDVAPGKATLALASAFAGASVARVDFESNSLPGPALSVVSRAGMSSPGLTFTLGPKEIVTLRIEKKNVGGEPVSSG
ncbi:MAG: glycoside hydrolase family 38 [Opitutaceae bacterium]|jgi:alpha-mannosidase/mannosylglycerate hydrolase|nr:glycoside hydrolase family 38 [Opitutaceae bacterium]